MAPVDNKTNDSKKKSIDGKPVKKHSKKHMKKGKKQKGIEVEKDSIQPVSILKNGIKKKKTVVLKGAKSKEVSIVKDGIKKFKKKKILSKRTKLQSGSKTDEQSSNGAPALKRFQDMGIDDRILEVRLV